MDRLIRKIIELLEANVKTQRGIKQIYWGDPFFIPKASIPSITVSPSQTVIETTDNVRDNDLATIEITLVFDARMVMNAKFTEFTALFEISKIMEERASGESHELEADTIVGVIRQLFYADKDFNLNVQSDTINYGFRDNREFPTVEAVYTIVVQTKPYTRA